MKTLPNVFSSLALLRHALFSFLLSLVLSHGQETGNGFLNIANLIPSKENVKITIMGKELIPQRQGAPSGLGSITSTGWFIVPAGNHVLSLSCEGYESASGTVTIEDTVSTLYVIYLEPVREKKDKKDDKPSRPQIRIKRCPAMDLKKSHYIEAMSVCPEEEAFQIGNKNMPLAPFTPKEIPQWNGGAFNVEHQKNEIGSCAGSQEKGSYFLLIGTDHQGKYASLMVRNEKQELPPWMKEDKKNKKDKKEATQP